MLLLLAMACAPAPITDVKVGRLDGMPSVIELSWTTHEPVSSQVHFGADQGLDLETPWDGSGTEHHALLLGLPAESEVAYQIRTAPGDVGRTETFTTGALPGGLPSFAHEGNEEGGFLIAPVYQPGGPAGPVIVDGRGRTVWQHSDARGQYITRARLLRDGSGVVYNSSDLNGDPSQTQTLVWTNWAGDEVRTEAVPLLGHDFVEKPDGRIVALAFAERDGVVGTKLVEIAPDGDQSDIWDAWQCFDPATTSHDEMAMGWTFANALDWDPATDQYTLSLRNFGSIVAVDGATGDCPWVLGGLASTVEIDGEVFAHQHQFDQTADTMLVFDNDGGLGHSRVLEFAFDPDAGTAEQVWAHAFDQWNVVLGDVQRLPDGDTLAVWAVHGQIDRIDSEGQVVSRLQAEAGTVIGFSPWEADLYPD